MFCAGESSLLTVFEAIDVIDWSRDEFFIYHSHPDVISSSSLLKYFERRKGKVLLATHFALNQRVLDTKSALNIQIR